MATRLVADALNVPTLIVARTDADAADLLTADVDERDLPFIIEGAARTSEGFYRIRAAQVQPLLATLTALSLLRHLEPEDA